MTPQSFDAIDWARAFVAHVRANPSIATDEETMLGWFANALMRGYDEYRKRNDLTRELLDLITLMPDSQTDEIMAHIQGLREIRHRQAEGR